MYDLAAAKDALAALENGDDPAAVRDALKALAALTKSLKRRLKTPARRRKGEGALVFREDKKLYQFEVELPRAPDGKRRRRVVYGKTAEETRRKVADLKARGGGSLRPVNPAAVRTPTAALPLADVSRLAGVLSALPDEMRRARGELGRAFGLLKHLFEMPMTASNATRHSLELSQLTRDARAAIQNVDASVEQLLDELASIREDLAITARRLARSE